MMRAIPTLRVDLAGIVDTPHLVHLSREVHTRERSGSKVVLCCGWMGGRETHKYNRGLLIRGIVRYTIDLLKSNPVERGD